MGELTPTDSQKRVADMQSETTMTQDGRAQRELKMRTTKMLATLGLVLLTTGCAVKKIAVNKLGDAIASAGEVYASDDDPELVREAVPFSLKLIESLLAESPRHRGLLVAVLLITYFPWLTTALPRWFGR